MNKKLISALSAAILAISIMPAAVSADGAGWQVKDGITRYVTESGSYAVGNVVIEGTLFSFAPDGTLKGPYTGFIKKNGGLVYYSEGKMFTGGWFTSGRSTYYSYPTGMVASGICVIDGKQYSFSNSGVLKTGSSCLNVTKDKDFILLGSHQSVGITVSADGLLGQAAFGEITQLHRFKGGKWYNVKPVNYAVDDFAYILGDQPGGSYVGKAMLSFCPEKYDPKITEGHYRAAIPIRTQSGTVTKYCEFDIIAPASITTPQDEYDLSSTNEITFNINVNRQSELYAPETYELYYLSETDGQWNKVEPKSTAANTSSPAVVAVPGTTAVTKLDLTRYTHATLKTGKYRAVVGDGLYCEFKLTAPFEAKVVQDQVESKRKRQVLVTVINKTDRDVTVKGYGQLYYYKNGKWTKVKAKKGFDTEMTVPAMHMREKSLMLTDYYSLDNLKKGNYCLTVTDTSGYSYQAQFTLK